uniref:Uncharacterized protein n=1 Tax=Podarcis muralis TaxID=64176 RepID=A0A670KBK8_PODMU
MGSNASWASVNASERGPYHAVASALNASSAQIAGINRSAHGNGTSQGEAYRDEQTYRHFTTAVQVIIFIGSLLGKTCVGFFENNFFKNSNRRRNMFVCSWFFSTKEYFIVITFGTII